MRKNIFLCVLALVVVSLICSSAFAAEAIKEGGNKVAVYGSGQFMTMSDGSDVDVTMYLLAGEYGYMITDEIELAVRTTVIWTETSYDDGEDDSTYTVFGTFAPKWHFNNESDVVPYVGPQVALVYAGGESEGDSDSQTGYGYGGFAGLDFFLSESTSVFVEYNLMLYTFPGLLGDDDLDVTNHAVNVGLAHYW